MGKNRIIPSDKKLQQFVDEGMTHAAIAKKVSIDTGTPVARSTISAALCRAGLTDRKRYQDVIPWTPIKSEHNMHYALVCLRLLARRKKGEELDKGKNDRLDSWLTKLIDNDAVVSYYAPSETGFHYIPRKPSDDPSAWITMRSPDDENWVELDKEKKDRLDSFLTALRDPNAVVEFKSYEANGSLSAHDAMSFVSPLRS